MADARDTPIDDVLFSVRAYNCLKNAGITTIGQLAAMSRAQVLQVRNLGKVTLRELELVLSGLGLSLADRRPAPAAPPQWPGSDDDLFRDMLAGLAICGLLSQYGAGDCSVPDAEGIDKVTACAYQIADSMMRAREGRP